MKATDFSLPDQNGKLHKLSDYKGKIVILYFYPKDDTPGCTKEACNFRDSLKFFQEKDVVILGISKDTVDSHKKFAKKFNLNFFILSDIDKKIIKEYKAWGKKSFMGKEFEGILRKTYLINKNGEIVKTYEKVNPLTHSQEILKDLKKF